MSAAKKFLIIQTAFPGDVVLTLPLAQTLSRREPGASVHMLVTPRAADLLRNHPAVARILPFDKRGRDSGLAGLLGMASRIRKEGYGAAFIPHRSLRSALLAFLGRVPRRIGFDRSAGRLLLSQIVRYDPSSHEIERNLRLLESPGAGPVPREQPSLYPPEEDLRLVESALAGWRFVPGTPLAAIAPGSVWATKRWLPERFEELSRRLIERGFSVILIGGREDAELCARIAAACRSDRVMSMAGQLSLLQSAAMIARSTLLVTNDSAPMHLAGAVGTPVIAIFGATAPSYGFGPTGLRDLVVETPGLSCRPCAIHGGDRCPIETFVCMKDITVDRVLLAAAGLAAEARP